MIGFILRGHGAKTELELLQLVLRTQHSTWDRLLSVHAGPSYLSWPAPLFLCVSSNSWQVFPEASHPGPGGNQPDCFAGDHYSFCESYSYEAMSWVYVTSSVKRLLCHIAILDLIGGHPFSKNSLKSLPGTGDCG